MKKITSFLAFFIYILNASAQCTSGCNPNTGTAYISHTPQCYGDYYQITIDGQYQYATESCSAGYSYSVGDGTYTVAFGTTYCYTFYNQCWISTPYQYCCEECYDYGTQEYYCCEYCTACNITYYEDSTTVSITIPQPPDCNISTSVSHTDNLTPACREGSITVTGTTNACDGYISYLYSIGGNYVTQLSAASGNAVVFSGLPFGTYEVKTLSVSGSALPNCEYDDIVIILNGACQSPYSFVVQPSSAYGCSDGSISIANNSSCTWGSNLYQFNPTNYPYAGFYNWYISDYDGGTLTYNGLPSGTYYLQNTSSVTNYDGQVVNCTVWDTIVVGPACQFNAVVTHTQDAYSACDGSITVTATTNACSGFHAYLTTTAGNYVAQNTAASGGTITFSALPYGSYTLHTYTYSNSPLCDRWDTIVFQNPGCHSPYHFAVQPASAYGCGNGSISITNASSCSWASNLYQFNPTNYPYAAFYNSYINTYYGGTLSYYSLPSGTYYLQSTASITNYDGVVVNCTVWDTIVVGPICQFNASVTYAQNANSACDGSISVTATTNACSGYFSHLYTLAGNNVTSQSAASGGTITFGGLPYGSYTLHTYTYSNSPLCDRWDTIVFQNTGCHSPYHFAVQPASAYGCGNGSISITNASSCTWASNLYQFNPTNYPYAAFYNWYIGSFYGGTLSYYSLPSGTYYLQSTASITNYDGQVLNCTVWDTIVVGPICQFNASVTYAQNANSVCDGSISVTATTNACSGFHAYLTTTAGNYVSQQGAASGGTITFGGLPYGSYTLHTYTYTNSNSPLCDRWDTIVFQNQGCNSPYHFAVQPASGYGCEGGSISITNASSCSWSSNLYRFDPTSYPFAGFLNWYIGSYYGGTLSYYGLPSGNYYLQSTASITNYDGQVLNCTVWDTIVVGPACILNATAIAESNSEIEAEATTNACNGYLAILQDSLGNTVQQYSASSGNTILFSGLNPEIYTVLISSYSSPSSNSPSCSQSFTLNLNLPSVLNLTLFLEGFYIGNSTMRNTLYNLGISSDATATDSIKINLWAPNHLSNPSPDYSAPTILHTNGAASYTFLSGVAGNSFYIAIKHRNSIETWSAAPVSFNAITSYDFTTGLAQAYSTGINPPMKNVDGVYAIYGGDNTQNGTIDISDMAAVDNDASQFLFGYNSTDCNGNGATDAADMAIVDNETQLLLFFARPY